MKERILEFLRKENKSSAQFAEEIGVQPSGISHILSGRNNPSLDFILKMLDKYPFISTDWLLFGKGSMYSEKAQPGLFVDNTLPFPDFTERKSISEPARPEIVPEKEVSQGIVPEKTASATLEVMKIVWFYNDNTFEEFMPRKD